MAQHIDVRYIRYYTPDSTARRVLPVTPQQTGTLPKMQKKKVRRIYVDPVAILGAGVAICMLIAMVVGVVRLQNAQEKTAQMTAYVEQLQMKNTALQAQYEEECDLEAVEKTALALGMIPAQQANRTTIQVELPAVEEPAPASIWQRIGTFLTGLFA